MFQKSLKIFLLKIMSWFYQPNEFYSFMGYRGDLYNEFMVAVDLAKKSIFDSKSQKELYKIAKVKRDLIFRSLNYSTKELIKSLKKRNKQYLLK